MYKAQGKPVPKEIDSTVYYNRGVLIAALHVEAVRNAIKAKGGGKGKRPEQVAARPSWQEIPAVRAGRLRAELQYGNIDEILATGLHAFLTQFLDRVNELGVRISRDFLVPA